MGLFYSKPKPVVEEAKPVEELKPEVILESDEVKIIEELVEELVEEVKSVEETKDEVEVLRESIEESNSTDEPKKRRRSKPNH